MTAIKTDGIGTSTTTHLNLTRSLADAWGVKVIAEPVVRLEAPDGRWLHRECNRLTLVRADAWSGRKSEGEALANKVGQGLRVK
jgi:hypothetical protein